MLFNGLQLRQLTETFRTVCSERLYAAVDWGRHTTSGSEYAPEGSVLLRKRQTTGDPRRYWQLWGIYSSRVEDILMVPILRIMAFTAFTWIPRLPCNLLHGLQWRICQLLGHICHLWWCCICYCRGMTESTVWEERHHLTERRHITTNQAWPRGQAWHH